MTNKDSFYPEEFYTDDRVTDRVNSGEAVLTAAQQRNFMAAQQRNFMAAQQRNFMAALQRNFMALANGERGGSGTQINITSNAIHEAEDFIGGKI